LLNVRAQLANKMGLKKFHTVHSIVQVLWLQFCFIFHLLHFVVYLSMVPVAQAVWRPVVGGFNA
jgi:hypothetical protein